MKSGVGKNTECGEDRHLERKRKYGIGGKAKGYGGAEKQCRQRIVVLAQQKGKIYRAKHQHGTQQGVIASRQYEIKQTKRHNDGDAHTL